MSKIVYQKRRNISCQIESEVLYGFGDKRKRVTEINETDTNCRFEHTYNKCTLVNMLNHLCLGQKKHLILGHAYEMTCGYASAHYPCTFQDQY